MSLRELYQEIIIDHGKAPRNFGAIDNANYIKLGKNPLCGDQLVVYLTAENNVIQSAQFQGVGCAISIASASLMTESLKGKTITQAKDLFTQFHNLVMGENTERDTLGKLAVFAGVAEFPARVKCASLVWHTMIAALNQDEKIVSTE